MTNAECRISDIAAFLAERRKNYPTKARTDAKKAAELAQKKEDKAASLQREADKLRKQLQKVESSIKRKREQGDEGDEMRDPTDKSSDDEGPETMSTKATKNAEPKLQNQGKKDTVKQCKYYATGGKCGKKHKCRFAHDPEVREAAIKEREANNGRLTIQQRLILNDKEQEDLTVLQSIQYLREKGLMPGNTAENGASEPAEATSSGGQHEAEPVAALPLVPTSKTDAASEAKDDSTPVADADKPADASADNAKHYEGWLLEPYGSNGPKNQSDDLP